MTKKTLTFWPLVGVLYFMVSGGPYGLEELVQKVGFGGAIAVLVATPLVWSLPTALLVGELGAALPLEGGYYAWVRRALGPFWGFQEAWLSFAASVFDMAIYPTLFALYVERLWPAAHAWVLPLELAFVATCVAWNLRGAKAVGDGSVVLTLALLAPFVVMSVAAIVHHVAESPATQGAVVPPGPAVAGLPIAATVPAGTDRDVLGGVLIAMWNYMGWDNASTVAAEVERPQRTYPRAVLVAVALVALTYVIPVAAVGHAGLDGSGWTTGSWVDAATQIAGRGVGIAVVIGGAISAFGMFNALLLSYSRVPAALAADGLLPKVLGRHSPTSGAPTVAIVACALLWTASLGLSFQRLVLLDVLLYGASLVLEFVALAVLRHAEPGLARPLRIPGGTVAVWLLGIPPTALLVLAVVRSHDETMNLFGAEVGGLTFGAMVMALGPLVYLWRANKAGARA